MRATAPTRGSCARPSPSTSRPAPGWWISAAGRCRCSTPRASSRSTSRRAAAPASSTSRTWAGSSSRSRLRHVPPACADQQRRSSGPAAGAVHHGAHGDRRRGRRRLPLPLRGWRVPAGRQRVQPAQGLGPLPRTPGSLPRRRDDGRDRRDRDAGPAGQDVEGHHRRPDRERRAPEPLRNELSVEPRSGCRVTGASWRRASPAPVTPASRSPSSSSCRRTTGRHCGTRWSRRAPCPSGSRPRHPAAGGRPPPVRPRARDRPGRQRDPHLQLPAGDVRRQLLAAQRGLHRPPPAGASAEGVRAHPAARLLTDPGPAPPHTAGGRDRPRHRPGGSAAGPRRGRRRALRRRDSPRLDHQRHGRPVLGTGGPRPLLAPDGGA